MAPQSFAPNTREKGQAFLAAVLLILFAMLTLITLASALALRSARISEIDFKSKRSYFLSESGVEDAVYRLKRGKNLPASYVLSLYGANTTITVSDTGFGLKDISSAADLANLHRSSKVAMRQWVDVSFPYGLQVGYLGLDMEDKSGVLGSVYSNGSVTGKNQASTTGDVWVAGGIAFSPDQEQSLQTSELLLRDISSRRDGAQSFIPSITADIRKVSLYIKKVGNPGDIDIKILPDNGGKPKNSGSEANGELKSSNVTASYSWVDVALNSNDPLLQGQKYWLVLDNGADDPTKYYILGADDDSSYTKGTFLYSQNWNASSPVWAESNKDSAFRIFMGTDNTFLDGMVVGGDAHANKIEDSNIAGDAYFQIIEESTVGGFQFPGSSDPSPQNMPLSEGQIAEFKAAGDAGGDCAPPVCESDGDLDVENKEAATIGPSRIIGNLRAEDQAVLNITGTIHVVGNLKFKNKCVVQLDPSYGQLSGVIVVDGTVSVEDRCKLNGSGDPSSYLMIITTNPGLGDPTALKVKNQATAAIFYASEGMIMLEDKVDVKEAVGQKMKLKNQAIVRYETGLANVKFSNGPTGGWLIDSWLEIP